MGILLLCFCFFAQATELNQWIIAEYKIALGKMSQNISPVGTAAGIVIASPSRQEPDYYFHWVRDSALVVNALLGQSPGQPLTPEQLKTVDDFISLSRQIQLTPSLTGLGEPRFNVDGLAYFGAWARPQNDGPALRALTLLHILDLGVVESRRKKISQILEADLDFIRTHFAETSFDIWEEIRADHFYTSLVQMAALKKAEAHFDPNWNFSIFDCEAARAEIEMRLHRHWSADKKYLSISLNRQEGGDNKKTDLDSAVILGVLHSGLDQADFFSVRDARVLSTAWHLENIFQQIYAINQTDLAPAIGRYEDDVYFGGNPWYLTTLAFAELHYRLAISLRERPQFQITELNIAFFKKAMGSEGNALRVGFDLADDPVMAKKIGRLLIDRGDQFVARVRTHAPADGALSEQFNRVNGFALSARDLTWSYASFLTAIQFRNAF